MTDFKALAERLSFAEGIARKGFTLSTGDAEAIGQAARLIAGMGGPVAWDFQVYEQPRWEGDSMREATWDADHAERQRRRGYGVRPLFAAAQEGATPSPG